MRTTLVVKERSSLPVHEEVLKSLRACNGFSSLLNKGVVSVRLHATGGEILAGPFIGAAHVSDALRIEIVEKSPGSIDALYHLASRADLRLVRLPSTYRLNASRSSWGRPAVWAAFLESVSTYVTNGLEKRYISPVVASSHPRGKLLVIQTIRRLRSRGVVARVIHRAPALSFSSPLNQLTRLALERICRWSGPDSAQLQRRALQLLAHFQSARLSPRDERSLTQAPDLVACPPQLQELRSLAAAVVRDSFLYSTNDIDPTLSLAYFLRLERLFEAAVFAAVEAATAQCDRLAAYQPAAASPVFVFPDQMRYSAKPDVIVSKGGDPILAIDAKYRVLNEASAHDSVYQLMAHCDAYGIKEGLLVTLSEDNYATLTSLGCTRTGIRMRMLCLQPRDLLVNVRKALSNYC